MIGIAHRVCECIMQTLVCEAHEARLINFGAAMLWLMVVCYISVGVPVWHYPAVANVTASTITINLPRRHHKAHHDHKMRLEHRWRQLPATQWQPWRTVEVIPADTTQYTLNQLITGVQPGAEHELRLGKMRKDETVSKYSLVAMISTPTRGECPVQKLVLASCYKEKKPHLCS